MTVTHKGELLNVAVAIAKQYEIDAFRAEVRADAYAAAGEDGAATADRKEAAKASAMAESALARVDKLRDELVADGFHVVIQPDGSVVCEPKPEDREGVQHDSGTDPIE